MARTIGERVAVVEEKVEDLELESLRMRQRLHDVESDRAALRLLVRQVTELTDRVDAIARRAAIEAVNLAMEHRNELGHRRWGLRIQWMGIGIAAAAAIAGLLAH